MTPLLVIAAVTVVLVALTLPMLLRVVRDDRGAQAPAGSRHWAAGTTLGHLTQDVR